LQEAALLENHTPYSFEYGCADGSRFIALKGQRHYSDARFQRCGMTNDLVSIPVNLPLLRAVMSINITLLETPTTMRKQKNGGAGNASLTVKVETEAGYVELDAHIMAGQVFYILDRDLSEVLKEN
jgi:hypothetical protein